MTIAIETVGLGKRYRKTWALQDCTLNIPAHRVVGLVGPNGAGKTTLLHLAVGLLRPSCGSIQVLGMSPVTQPHLVLPRLGFVAQEHPLYRTLTVEDMLVFGRASNPQWNEAFARTWLVQLGIPPGHSCGTLSGGQQAQVALVLALAKRPEMLLLDEPIASLDPLARQTFQQLLMENVAAEGHTVLFSSHLVADLERVCDYIIILAASHVQIADEIEHVLHSHKRLTGPHDRVASIARTHTLIQTRKAERHTTLLVRLHGPILDPAWIIEDVTLEDIVLGYLAQPTHDTQFVGQTGNRLEVVQCFSSHGDNIASKH